jgi:hypothetical protein
MLRDSVSQSDLEAVMAHRHIGQEVLRLEVKAERQSALDAILALIDWAEPDRLLAGLYPSAMGEKAWPPLAKHKSRAPAHGYRAHIAADKDSGR